MNDNLNEDEILIDEKNKHIMQIIAKADKGEHCPSDLLCSIGEYRVAKTYAKAVKKITKMLYKSANNLYREYVSLVEDGEDRLDLLLTHISIKRCADFYYKECLIVNDTITEFKVYARGGNLIRTLLGYARREEDMFDFRGPSERETLYRIEQ